MPTVRLDRRLLVKLALTCVFLYVVFRFVPLGEVLRTIAGARPLYIGVAVPLVLLGPFMSAARLGVLMRSQAMMVPLTAIVRVNFVVAFYGFLLPGLLAGGVLRWHKLVQLENRKAEVLAALFYARFVYLAVMAALGVTFLLTDLGGSANIPALLGLALLCGFLFAALLITSQANRPAARARIERLGWSPLTRLAEAVARYRQSSVRDLASVFILATMENLVGLLSFFLLARALDVTVSLLTLGWVRSVVLSLASLPITISGLGVREGGLIIALEPYGVAGTAAVALSFLLLGRNLLLAAVGGWLEARSLFSASAPSG